MNKGSILGPLPPYSWGMSSPKIRKKGDVRFSLKTGRFSKKVGCLIFFTVLSIKRLIEQWWLCGSSLFD